MTSLYTQYIHTLPVVLVSLIQFNLSHIVIVLTDHFSTLVSVHIHIVTATMSGHSSKNICGSQETDDKPWDHKSAKKSARASHTTAA